MQSQACQSATQNLIWIDLEMTGLYPERDVILEIATVVTDHNLNIIAEGPVLAIHQSDGVLSQMGEWCRNQHTKSGLVTRVRRSDEDIKSAEKQTLEFLRQYVQKGQSPMCGNSVWQDRRFLCKYMPTLEDYFHYRMLDVSSVKILSQMYRPEVAEKVKKNSSHLAMDDIKDSIKELKLYRDLIFLPS